MRVKLRVTFLTRISMKYKFTLERRKKDGEVIEKNMPIRIVVNHLGKRITLSTGFRIDKKAWSAKKEVVKPGFINKQGEPYNIINANLSGQAGFIDKYALKKQLEDKPLDLDELKSAFAAHFSRKKGKIHKDKNEKKTFFELFDAFVEERGKQNDWTDATYTKFKTVRSHLNDFDSGIELDNLNEEELTEYVLFLRDKKDMKNSTIKKQLGFLKWFLNWTVEKGHTSNTTYKKFKPKLKTAEKQVVYLTREELDQVRNLKIPESKQYLERVRDVFLFCCYTALRHSDVYKLKRTDIKNQKVERITQKTVDKLTIKLTDKALAILEKYKDTPFKNDKILPVISNQRMNEYLKELARLAKINEPITDVYFKGNVRHEDIHPKHSLIGTHTGRRTFICNALMNGMPANAVMKITGHSDYKAMQPYIDIVSRDVDNMVDKFVDF
jgi:integrase